MQRFAQLKSQFELASELPQNFPKEVINEAAKLSKEPFNKDKNREDFRHLHTICIDPLGARDHDDAISVEETKSGYVLGVHIADLSYFVKPGSALDKEAQKRAYTQYLPWGSFPMFPEIISANLCSLKENENRFSFSCIINLDRKCKILKYRFTKGLIKVSRSITYEKAMELFEKKDKHIYLLAKVAFKLKKSREENGLLEMGSTEYQCQFSKKGEPLCIVSRQSEKSNSWIEECMLAANKCCALELQKRKLKGIYRIHEAPDPEDLAELMQGEPTLFFDSPIDPNKLLRSYRGDNSQDKRIFQLYAHLVKKANGNPILINRILRSMQKAQYSPECSGHFALHWRDYAHFTAPIRRYADLWCHRELCKATKTNQIIRKGKASLAKTQTADICSNLNDAEIKNQKIERKALKLCASYLLQDQVGQTFSGEVQGIEEFGIFVSISTNTVALAEGLVHLRDIPGDYYVYNEARGILVGKRSGKRFKRGDKVTVKLVRVNPIKGENDFEICNTRNAPRNITRNAYARNAPARNAPACEVPAKKRRFGR
ncbi:MAG: RNB domain-containing ribonuclease [Fibromonadaceae bacterium]|jgi:ribonuclease R|nr:RNB domain-containing ribonuclease [Fibromonadaceae bacterium]